MANTMSRRSSYEVWETLFQPEPNHLDPNAAGGRCLFETYGNELAFVAGVAASEPDRVWTLVDYDGTLYVTSGMHYVNRLGYFVTKVPLNPNDKKHARYQEYDVRY